MEETTNTPEPATARVLPAKDGTVGAIVVSDLDPDDAALRRNARDVHTYAGELLSQGQTNGELRFLAKSLRQALGDMLDMSE